MHRCLRGNWQDHQGLWFSKNIFTNIFFANICYIPDTVSCYQRLSYKQLWNYKCVNNFAESCSSFIQRNASQSDEIWKSLESSFEHEHTLVVKAQTNSFAWKCMYTYCLGMRKETNLSVSVLRENQVAVIESWGWQTATMHSVNSRIRVASKATRRNC